MKFLLDFIRRGSVPLRKQLVRSQILVTNVVLIASAIGFLINDWYLAHKAMLQIVDSTGSVISQNLITPLAFDDQNEAQKTLDSLKSHPVFEGAVVRDLKGQIFAQFHSDSSKNHKDEGLEYSIENHGDKIGTLSLIPKQKIQPQMFYGYILVFELVMMAGIFLSRVLGHMTTFSLVAQIDQLLSLARSVRESHNYSLRAPTELEQNITTAEVSRLASEFNEMLSVIEARSRDIEDLNKNLEKIVQERTRELVEAQSTIAQQSRLSALGEVSASIGHEVNNPLAVILGKTRKLRRMLEQETVPSQPILVEIETIDQTANRIAKVIKGLKSLSRDGAADPFEECRVKSIIDDTLELCQSRFQSHGVELRVQPYDENLRITCRPTQIGQVLLNLLNNGHDAVEKLPQPWVQIEVKDDADFVLISVSDSGPGIPVEVREKLMQPFFTTKGVGKGTGLGLSISKKIVATHGGEFMLDPALNRTCFHVKLCKKIVVTAQPPQENEQTSPPRAQSA